jgi:hypothetical protein
VFELVRKISLRVTILKFESKMASKEEIDCLDGNVSKNMNLKK